MEKFSVLMSLYSKEKPNFLRESLESVFTNTILPDQVVLVLDGPIGEELQEIVKTFQDKYPALDVYPQLVNKGLSTALNIGLGKCRNDIVFRMDTDDVCYPNRFEKILQEYEKYPELEIIGSSSTLVDENGEKDTRVHSHPLSQKDIYRLVWLCPFGHPTVSFRKNSILSVGSYNPNSGPRQDDYELWFRCVAAKLKCKNIPEPLIHYRFSSNSMSRNDIAVGWWRAKVGLKGCWKCHCSFIAYFGVCYPLLRSLLPPFLQRWLYVIAEKKKTKKITG